MLIPTYILTYPLILKSNYIWYTNTYLHSWSHFPFSSRTGNIDCLDFWPCICVYVVVALRLSSSRVSAVVVVDRGSPDCACVRHAARAAPPPPCDGTPAPAGLVSLCTAALATYPAPLAAQSSQSSNL